MPRHDGRKPSELRPIRIERPSYGQAAGRVLFAMGRTTVLCTCSVELAVPSFLLGSGKGWLTAEYSMLPGSTGTRKPRDRGVKIDGRSVEIQRLIGRSLRTAVDLTRIGERTLTVDCDVLEADGGTRTASINGGYLAIVDALRSIEPSLPHPLSSILLDSVAAVSVGLLDGVELLDLDYREDRDAEVDLNLVMTGAGRIVEVQAGGEESTFTTQQLEQMLKLGKQGITGISTLQKSKLSGR